MAHVLDMTQGKGMAYVGERPWHGLGQQLTPDAPLEVWQQEAGLDWHAESWVAKAEHPNGGSMVEVPNTRFLVRSDSGAILGKAVSDGYKIVQPKEVIEFYRDLTESQGYTLETAGSLQGGEVIWALAKTGNSTNFSGDIMESYILLASAFGVGMATRAMKTAIRVVCSNTLNAAFGPGKNWISISHSSVFDADAVKKKLGVSAEDWEGFSENMEKLITTNITDSEARKIITEVLVGKDANPDEHMYKPTTSQVYGLYQGNGMGATLPTAKGTLFGLVNAFTEYADHWAGSNRSSRLNSAWFGSASNTKSKALAIAMERANAA